MTDGLGRDDDSDLDDLLGDPNGPAYQVTEQRTGPPLGYVAEKSRSSLEMLHDLFQTIQLHVPDDLPQPELAKETPFSTKQDGLLSPAWSAFRYGIVAYLALNNMLVMANDHTLFERLLGLTGEEFRNWLDTVDEAGSVT